MNVDGFTFAAFVLVVLGLMFRPRVR